jgi:hypothetical protein
MDEENLDQLQRQIYQLENQIGALSDQVWALMRDGKVKMGNICEQIDAGKRISESDLLFIRGMLGCLLAELSCREAKS